MGFETRTSKLTFSLVSDFPCLQRSLQVWLSMRKEAKAAAEKEPLLVSFIYSTILNQKTLEAAVAFHLANKVCSFFVVVDRFGHAAALC